MARSSIEQIIHNAFNRLRSEGIGLIHSIVDQYKTYSETLATSMIIDFYHSYSPSIYDRKYDLYEGIQFIDEELKLDASGLQPFRSGASPDMILKMVGMGIRYFLPWNGEIKEHYINNLSMNMGAIGTFHYKGNIQGAISTWNTYGKQMFVDYFDKQIIALINNIL